MIINTLENVNMINCITHEGKIILFSNGENGQIRYAVKQEGYENNDLKPNNQGWEDWSILEFPNEIPDTSVEEREKANSTYKNDSNRYISRSIYKTIDLTAPVPVQIVSGLGYLYVFRQSKEGILLVDRFVLDRMENKLVRKLDLRYKRSRQKFKPLNESDSLDFLDSNNLPFFEPTTELSFINYLECGWFSVVLIPTEEHDKYRWHFFAYNKHTKHLELTTIRASDDGLFDLKDYQYVERLEEQDNLNPTIIPGITKRNLKLKNDHDELIILNGPVATKYDVQSEIQTDDGPQLIRIATRIMLAVPINNHGNIQTAALSFAVAKDGTLAQISEKSEMKLLKGNERDVFLPLNTLDEIKAVGKADPPAKGIITGMEKTDDDFVKIATAHATTLKKGEMVKIDGTTHYDGHYTAKKIDDNAFEIEAAWSGNEMGYWEAVPEEETGLIFDGMITSFEKNPDNRLRIACISHGLEDGNEVQIKGTKNYNGIYSVDYINENSFTIDAKWKPGEAENLKLVSRKRRSISFNGIDDYLETPALPIREPLMDEFYKWTCSAWINISSKPKNKQVIIGRKDGFMEIFVKDNFLTMNAIIRGKLISVVHNRKEIALSQWIHCAGVLSYAKKEDSKKAIISLYINGEMANETVIDISSLASSQDKLLLMEWNPEFIIAKEFNGKISDVQIWNVARTPREIKNGMHLKLAGNEAGLCGYWPMEAMIDQKALDFSDYGNDAIVHGDPFISEISLPRKLRDGKTDAIRFINEKPFAVSQQATYIESFEFKVAGPIANSNNANDKIFKFIYSGKRSRGSEQAVDINSEDTEFKELEDGWHCASCRFTVPNDITLMRSFGIGEINGNWDNLSIRKHRIRLISDSISEVCFQDELALKELINQGTDIEEDIRTSMYLERVRDNYGLSLDEFFENWQKMKEVGILSSSKYLSGMISVTMDNSGNCIEVHVMHKKNLYYRVGKIDFDSKEIDWGYQVKYGSGDSNSIALGKEGNCIEVHRRSEDFYYRVGKIDFTCKTILFGDEIKYNKGESNAISMDDNGNCIEVHGRSGHLYYHVGKIDFVSKQISFDDEINYDSGEHNAISMNDNGNCIEIHVGSGNLYYRVGEINFYSDRKISFGNSIRYKDKASDRNYGSNNIAMDNNGNFIETHGESNGYYDCSFGKANFESKSLEFVKQNLYNYMAIAMDNNGNFINLEACDKPSHDGPIEVMTWDLGSLNNEDKIFRHMIHTNLDVDIWKSSFLYYASRIDLPCNIGGDEVRNYYKEIVKNISIGHNSPLEMTQVMTDKRGLAIGASILNFINPISRLNIYETCEGNVQISYFDKNGRLSIANFDSTADSATNTFEQWIPDSFYTCIYLNNCKNIIELGNPIPLSDEWTIEAMLPFYYDINLSCSKDKADSRIAVRNGHIGTKIDGIFYGFECKNFPDNTDDMHHIAAVGKGDTTIFYIDGLKICDIKEKTIEDLKTKNLPENEYKIELEKIKSKKMKSEKDISIIGYADEGERDKLCEIRIWNVALDDGEIEMNSKIRMTGNEPGLMGYYPMNEGSGTEIRDHSGNNNHVKLPQDSDPWLPAPIGVPLEKDDKPINLPKDYPLVCAEYSTILADSDGNMCPTMMRFYAYPENNGICVLAGKRVEDLEMKWVGNAQYKPTLLGYIEGAPPVPSENLTEEENYNGATTIELAQSSDISYEWEGSEEFKRGFELEGKIGAWSETEFGLGITQKATFGAMAKFNAGMEWATEIASNVSTQISRKFSDTLSLRGTKEIIPRFPHIGSRFIPKNIGYALIISGLADIFILRLKRSKKMVSYFLKPCVERPADVNTLTFMINPAYTMSGSLDGLTGTRPTSERFFKDVPEMRSAYGSSYPASYLRIQEAYELKNKIEEQDKNRELFYQNYSIARAKVGCIVQTDKTDDGAESYDEKNKEQGLSKVKDKKTEMEGIKSNLSEQVKEANKSSGLRAWQEKMQELRRKARKQNIVNTYVWDADGGLRKESQEFADTIEHSIKGSYNLDLGAGAEITFKFGVGFELNPMAKFGYSNIMSKKESYSEGFGLNVDLSGVEGRGITDYKDLPLMPGEKVDRYRFMSFFLEGDTKHFNDFFNQVVDLEWLAGNDEEARVLREIKIGKPNKTWRVLHRVTYVERPSTAGFGRDTRKLRIAEERPKLEILLEKVGKLEKENSDLKAKIDEILVFLKKS